MDTILTTLAPAFGTAALKLWGSYAFVLIVLIWAIWRSERRLKDKDTEIATLREENKAIQLRIDVLQEKRVEDARHLDRLIETGNERMVSRYSGDQKQTDALATMALALQDIRARLDAKVA